MYSFRMSFCSVPESARERHALLLGDRQVHGEQHRRRRVDRHRRRDVVERDARRTAAPCRRACRSRRLPGRPRRAPARRRCRGPSASAGRRRPRARSGPARAGSGSARSSRSRVPKPANCRIVHSRPRYIVGWIPRVNGILARASRAARPGPMSGPRSSARVQALDRQARRRSRTRRRARRPRLAGSTIGSARPRLAVDIGTFLAHGACLGSAIARTP